MINQEILSSIESMEQDFGFFDNLLKLECFSIVDHSDDLECLKDERLQKWLNSHDEFLILGTGGSSLGAQCIYEISKSHKNSTGKKITFVSNLDPCTLNAIFSDIKDLSRVGILCISKSGETLETITQFLLISKLFSAQDLSSIVVVITENKASTLKQIAIDNDFLCLDHPKTIGGRFSVFSIVGMLPAVICGIDPFEIRNGGKKILHGNLNDVKAGVAFIIRNFRKNITNHVSFIYSDKLMFFAEWLAQLYAESSGKLGIGVTPITARGSVDQHSQLQLYLDGCADKCFSFFYEKQTVDLSISNNNLPDKFAYLNGKRVSEIFEAQCSATIDSLLEKKRPLRKFAIPAITPEILGELFMHFMIEVPSVCNLIGVTPFDQPAVERGKVITKTLLSNGIISC